MKELKKTCNSMMLKQCTSALGLDKTRRIKVCAGVMQFGCAVLRLTLLTSTRLAEHHHAAWHAAPDPPPAEGQALECLVD